VGSAKNLTHRLMNYYSNRFLTKELARNRSIISSALLKYNYSNFSLDILEYCELNVLLLREQYYIDSLICEYNISKIAGSRLGCKHTPETLLKFKTRKLSTEALINLKLAKRGYTPPWTPLRKENHLTATGHITIVKDINTNNVEVYRSLRDAARYLNTSHNALLNYINKDKL
jgi:group I intron endonuclease